MSSGDAQNDIGLQQLFRHLARLGCGLKFLPTERLHELAPESFRHGVLDADFLWRTALRIVVVCAENQIPEHEVFTVVFVPLAQVHRVMPAMQRRRVEDVTQHAKFHADVAVRQETDVGRNRPKPQHHILRRPRQREQRRGKDDALQRVNDVEATRVEKPQFFRAVMHRVKPPERHPLMRHTVRPVEPELRHDKREQHLKKHRPFIRPESRPPFPAHHSRQSKPRQRNDEELHDSLRERRVCEIRDFLPIRVQPFLFMRIQFFDQKKQPREAEEHNIECKWAVTVGDADAGRNQRPDQKQRPERVIQQSQNCGGIVRALLLWRTFCPLRESLGIFSS